MRLNKILYRSLLRFSRDRIVKSVPFKIPVHTLGIPADVLNRLLPLLLEKKEQNNKQLPQFIYNATGLNEAIKKCFSVPASVALSPPSAAVKRDELSVSDISFKVLKSLNNMKPSMTKLWSEHLLHSKIEVLDKAEFRVGQVVQHKSVGYRGVIIGWDVDTKTGRQRLVLLLDQLDINEFLGGVYPTTPTFDSGVFEPVKDNLMKRIYNTDIPIFFQSYDEFAYCPPTRSQLHLHTVTVQMQQQNSSNSNSSHSNKNSNENKVESTGYYGQFVPVESLHFHYPKDFIFQSKEHEYSTGDGQEISYASSSSASSHTAISSSSNSNSSSGSNSRSSSVNIIELGRSLGMELSDVIRTHHNGLTSSLSNLKTNQSKMKYQTNNDDKEKEKDNDNEKSNSNSNNSNSNNNNSDIPRSMFSKLGLSELEEDKLQQDFRAHIDEMAKKLPEQYKAAKTRTERKILYKASKEALRRQKMLNIVEAETLALREQNNNSNINYDDENEINEEDFQISAFEVDKNHALEDVIALVKDLVNATADSSPANYSINATDSFTHTPVHSSAAVLGWRNERSVTTDKSYNIIRSICSIYHCLDQLLQLRFQNKGLTHVESVLSFAPSSSSSSSFPSSSSYSSIPLDNLDIETSTPSLKFKLGQVCMHQQFNYKCVISGYDIRPLADVTRWEGVLNTENKGNQPFYRVIPHQEDVENFLGKGEFRQSFYVAQDNLKVVENPIGNIKHRDLKYFFENFDDIQKIYIAPSKLRFCFPTLSSSSSLSPSSSSSSPSPSLSPKEEKDVEKIWGNAINAIDEQEFAVCETILVEMLRILKRSFTATRTAYKAVDGMIDNSSNSRNQNHTSQIDGTTDWNGTIGIHSLPLEDLLTMLRHSKTREDAISVEALVWLIYMSHDDVQVAKLMRLGVSEMKRGLHSQAFDYFLKAVTIDPLYAEAHNKLAALHHKIGEHEECARRANFALQLLPCHYGALAGLGMAQESRNDRMASEKALRKALQIHPWASHVPTILGTLARSQSSSPSSSPSSTPSDSTIPHELEPIPPV